MAKVQYKHAFIRLAQNLGLAVQETTLFSSRDDLEAVRGRSRHLVFKPVWSRFASHVLLRPTPDFLARRAAAKARSICDSAPQT